MAAVAFRVVGAIATVSTGTTLTLTGPSAGVEVDDIYVAMILGKNNLVVTAPAGWTKFVEIDNTTGQRVTLAWKRVALADIGAAFAFTRTTDTTLFGGVIACYSGCLTTASPIDTGAPSTSANVSSDTVTYATFDPVETAAFVVAVGVYNDDEVTPGLVSGTNPTFAANFKAETTSGTDWAVFSQSGASDGAATGGRTQASNSVNDAINIGVLFGLRPDPTLLLLSSLAVTRNRFASYAPVPAMAKPAYLTPVINETFGTKTTRIGGNPGLTFNYTQLPLPGTAKTDGVWGTRVRHRYSSQQPWNADESLIWIDNTKSGSNAVALSTTANGTTTLTTTGNYLTSNVKIGDAITGGTPAPPAGAKVASIESATSLTMSAAITAGTEPQSRTFTRGTGTPKRLLLDGTTYAVKYGLGPALDAAFWDVRWHPTDPAILINVTQDGTKLQWWDILTDTKVREWALDILFEFPADYGVGSGTGNVSDDGRLFLLVGTTQIAVLDMSVYPEVRIGPAHTLSPNPGQDHGGMSGSGLYAFLNFGSDSGGNGEQMRVFNVHPDTLALTPRDYTAYTPYYVAAPTVACTTTTGSPAVTSAALFGVTPSIEPGMRVTGPGIPADTKVLSVASNSALTLDKNVTTPDGAQTLTFTDDYANGYIRRMGHEDCFRNPYDNGKDYLAGQNQAGGTGTTVNGKLICHVNRISFETGVLDPLTLETDEATSHHISTRNIRNPDWVCVTWFESATNQRNAGEATLCKVDGTFEIARFCHTRSNTPGVYQAEKHGVASPTGRRIMFASNWALSCGGTCGNAGVNGDQQSYVVEFGLDSGYATTAGVLTVTGVAAMLSELRRADAPLIALVKVYLSHPTVKTLYLSSNYIETPDPFQLWEGVIVGLDPIRAPGSHLGSGPDLCTAGITLATRAALGFQAGEDDNLTKLFKDWRWRGAAVEIYLWSQRLTSFTNQALKVFTGTIINAVIQSDGVNLSLLQRTDWQKIVSPVIVARDKFPRAPDRSVGKPLPLVYGAVKSLEMHEPPWGAPYSRAVHDLEHVFGGQIAMPALCVDTGRGGSNQRARYLVAGHAVKSHNAPSTDATTYFLKMNDVLVPLDPTAVVNTSAGAGFELADGFKGASYPVAPIDVAPTITAPGDDLRLAMDQSDVSFARLIYQPSGPLIDKRRGWWLLPDIAPPGDFDNASGFVYVRLGYKSSATLTNFKVGLMRIADLIETITALPASTTPTGASVTLGVGDWGSSGFPNAPWAFSEVRLIAYWDSLPVARQEVWLYFIGLEVPFKPTARIWAPGYTIREGRKYTTERGREARYGSPERAVQADTEIEADFYGSVEGQADDVDGLYSGVASALIERPCDIMHHFLRSYCAQAGKIQLGVGSFGSFVDARSSLLTRGGQSIRSSLVVIDVSDAETVLQDLTAAGFAWCYLDRFSDKWHWVPWLTGAGTDYGRRVWRDDIIALQIDGVPSSRVPSGVRVQYAYDPASRQFLRSTHVSVNASGGGHRYQEIRDEQEFKVTLDINDKLDFAVAGFNGASTLTPGSYATGHALAKEADARMEADATSADFMVCFGTTIEAGYNDKLNVNDGTVKTGTVAPGTYATMEALAAAYQTALNAASTNWTAVYNRTTRKATIDRSSGTKTLLTNSGGNKATTAFTLIGYDSIADVSGGTAAQHSTEEDMFHFECLTGALDLLFASGANGSNAAAPKNCAELFGFTAAYDRDAAGAARHWVADCPRDQREKVLADAAAAYGSTRERTVDLRNVYDTRTAREVRNRIVDRLKVPLLVIRFSTSRMPDLRRGELIRFDDLDNFKITYPKPGSDGLWAGKKFRVTLMQQRLGPSFDQEIECIENG